MRYSLFFGLPLGILALTAIFELALRITTYDAALMAGLITMAAVVFALHKWDEMRLKRLLNPPSHVYPVGEGTAREYLVETLRQIDFEDAAGLRTRWRLSDDPDDPTAILGKVRVKSRTVNQNMVAWLIELADRGSTAKTIELRLELAEAGNGTRVMASYKVEPPLDWTRCEEVISETEQWLEESMSRSALSQSEWH